MAPAGTTAAVLDVGSNSVLLLVARLEADGRLEVIDAGLETTRLGRNLATGGSLDPAACLRTRDAVVAFAARARAAGASRLWAFATGAARRASNGREFATATGALAGCPIEVLSGEREARLAYAAATSDRPRAGWVLVVDVGGSTTELTLGQGPRIEAVASLVLGALMADTEREETIDARLASAEVLRRARECGAPVVASGGTATALAAVDLGLDTYDAGRVHGHVLRTGQLRALAARAPALVGGVLDPGRAQILPVGARVLSRVASLVDAAEIRVSDRGVRHAYLVERLRAEGLHVSAEDPWG